MSFEKKLYDIEVNPPQMVWEKISTNLDDLSFENSLKNKLVDINAEPPAVIWNQVKKNLDEFEPENIIADKLSQFNEIPPTGIWNKINAELDNDLLTEKFAKHLIVLEITPPESNWQSIISELDNQIPVVPLTRKSSRFIKYAAAAVILGFVAWGGIQLLNTGTNKPEEVATTKIESAPTINTPQSQSTEVKTADNNSTTATGQDEKTDTPKEQLAALNKREIKNKPGSMSTNKNLLASLNTFQNNHSGTEEIVADVNNLQQNKRVPITTNNADTTAPRYLVYLNEEGSLIKVSKKLADLKCIYTKDGEITQGALASLNKQICTDLVKTWQEKLAKAPFSSFDPLELADILK